MIAARFRLIAWVAGCAMAALLCYMASQSVAAERGALARVDGEIADTQNDIRRLETEIAARSRMGQLERWNRVLALQAARPVQYVANEVQLASLAGGRKLPLDPAIVAAKGAVDVVSYQKPAPVASQPAQSAPAPAAPAIQTPMLREATYVRPAPSRLAEDAGDPAPVVKTALEKPAPKARMAAIAPDAKPKLTLASLDLSAPAPAPRPKAKAVTGLLPSDLGSLIAAEKKGAYKKGGL